MNFYGKKDVEQTCHFLLLKKRSRVLIIKPNFRLIMTKNEKPNEKQSLALFTFFFHPTRKVLSSFSYRAVASWNSLSGIVLLCSFIKKFR